MSDLLIQDLDDNLLTELQQNADAHGHSAADEVKRILNQALMRKRTMREFIEEADEFARRIGPQSIDSTDIIREERDQL